MDSIALYTQMLNNIDTKLLDLSANPKPNYSINGQSISWQSLFESLIQQRQNILQLLVVLQGPGETVIEGIT